MATRMQQRRGTAAQWTAANPTLAAGEIGFETDTNKFKMGNGSSAWTSLAYFVDASIVFDSSEVQGLIDAAVADLVGGAPNALNSIWELANSINGDANYAYTVATSLNGLQNTVAINSNSISDLTSNVTNLTANTTSEISWLTGNASAHTSANTSVHGISNTLNLVYNDNAALTNERTPVNGSVTDAKIANTAVTAAKIASDAVETGKIANGAVTAAKLATDSVETAKIKDLAVTNAKLEGSIAQSKITDLVSNLSAKLASADAATTYAPIASPTFTGTVSGVTKSHVGLGNVDNTTDDNKPVSSATQTALDLKAPLASPTLTGVPTAPTANTLTNTTQIATTAFVQQEIAILTDSAPGLLNTLDELAAALGDDANFAATTANAIALKAPLASPTFTGTVSGITATMVGLGSVDNTADTAKPVSTAQQTALDLKANLASPTFTGLVTVAANGIAFSDGTQTKEGVPSRTSIISKTASYTLTDTSERDSLIEVNSGSATTITIPLNSAVAYPVGTTLDILQTGAGQVTIAGDSGVTVNSTPGLKLRTQWSSCTLFKRATDSWVVFGDLSA